MIRLGLALLCSGCSYVTVFEFPGELHDPPVEYTERAEAEAPPASHVIVLAECAEGDTIAAGGCFWGGYRDQLTPTHDHPEITDQAEGWKCGAWNGSAELVGMVEAWAICEGEP